MPPFISWESSSSSKPPPNADLKQRAHTDPLGLYGIPVDGNDVVAIYRVAQEAIHRARRGVVLR